MTTDEERGFLRSIIEQPHADTARLAYADWLDEHGRADRAELIRAQCELERRGMPSPNDERTHDLAVREHKLLSDHGREWARVTCPACKGDPSRGLGFKCSACQNTGDAMMRADDPAHDGTATATPHFRRGFVERVEVPALSWVFERRYQGHAAGLPVQPDDTLNATEWRVTPWALAVAAAHPVTEFVIGDREPWSNHPRTHWGWWAENSHSVPDDTTLPLPVMLEMRGNTRRVDRNIAVRFDHPGQTAGCILFDSRESALSALATGAADWVRAKVLEAWANEVRT